MFCRPVRDEEIGQTVEHVVGSEPSRNDDRQAPARELVEHHEQWKVRPSRLLHRDLVRSAHHCCRASVQTLEWFLIIHHFRCMKAGRTVD